MFYYLPPWRRQWSLYELKILHNIGYVLLFKSRIRCSWYVCRLCVLLLAPHSIFSSPFSFCLSILFPSFSSFSCFIFPSFFYSFTYLFQYFQIIRHVFCHPPGLILCHLWQEFLPGSTVRRNQCLNLRADYISVKWCFLPDSAWNSFTFIWGFILFYCFPWNIKGTPRYFPINSSFQSLQVPF
jgi:hypothetical protein